MADFFDQICEVLAENGKKYPGQLTANRDVEQFFAAVPLPPPLPQAAAETLSQPSGKAGTPAPAASPHVKAAVSDKRFSDLQTLAESVTGCRNCPLCSRRQNVVFGEGDPDARLMFIGEAPGYEEDIQGRPFVGAAGKLLDKMIKAMQFTREEVYIANIIKCRPPENRTPAPDEISRCIPFLYQQIRLIRPEVIICLGATAAKALLNTPNGISRLRGKWCSFENIPVMPTFHPAFLLRQETAKRDAWNDLKLVISFLAKGSR